jgi:hypothetical protein
MPPDQHSYQERSNLEHYAYIHNIFNLRDNRSCQMYHISSIKESLCPKP